MENLIEIPILSVLGIICGLTGTLWNFIAKKMML